MRDKKIFELHLPLQNGQNIKIPKDSHILSVRTSIDKTCIILSYSGYEDADIVQRGILMYFETPFVIPLTSIFLGVCDVMREKVGYFPGLVSTYVFID